MSQTQKELIDKMNRKISQLTRVVYILNSKNDENESIMESITSAFESEVQSVSREANQVIKKMKNQIDKIRLQTNPEEKLNLINDKYEKSLQSFKNEYDKLKKESQKKTKSLSDEYNDKYNKMMKDLVELKRQSDIRINEIMKRNDEEKRKLQMEREKEKYSSLNDIDNIKKSYEEKIAYLISQHKTTIQNIQEENNEKMGKMKIEYEKKILEYKKLLEASNSTSSKQLDELKNDFNKTNQVLKEQNEKLNEIIKGLQADIESYKIKIVTIYKE